jgi:hypothetical protein
VTFEEQYEHPGSMKWRKGAKKGAKKGGKRERQPRGFTVTLFRVLFRHFFFSISPELQVGPRSFRFPTLFVLLIGKGKKNRAKNEENGKKGEKGWQKGREKGQL